MDLTKDDIPKLVWKIALPAMIGFFFNTMYNVVDTFYAGQLSTEALAALSLSFPVFFVIIAFGSGLSTGATALISHELGSKHKRKARLYTSQAVLFSIVFGGLLTLCVLFLPYVFMFLGATESYLGLVVDYMTIIFYGAVLFLTVNTLNAPLQASGDTKTFRNFLIFGFLLNIILDPWFMNGGFGVPAMGISGIALATILIQVAGVVYMWYKASKTGLLVFDFKPRWKYIKDLVTQGFPSSMSMMTVSLGFFIITYNVSEFGAAAIAGYGTGIRVEQIMLLPTIGLNIAVLSLVGQNYGAGNIKRIKEVASLALKYGFYIMTVGAALVYISAPHMMKIFSQDADVINAGVSYLRVDALIFWAYMIVFISISVMQGLKKPMYALYVGLGRQILAPLILYGLLASYFGLRGIWWGIFMITWASAVITFFISRRMIETIET
ncbi:MATE family efflux transporter [Candidatus Woesearchaeota archaeon]|nr:MATE family efflux transporter [Candidatus Woesearchaeota archaeon]